MPTPPTAEIIFGKAIEEHLRVVAELRAQEARLAEIAHLLRGVLRSGGKILWCGNGGSAADAQHLAAEIVGRFGRERRGLPSIALTTDSSVLTSVANDYGFEQIFARQVEALATPRDVLIGISTSGNSPNVVAALERARKLGVRTVAFTGVGGGAMGSLADLLLAVPSKITARIQEAHILAGHVLCDWLEADWLEFERQCAQQEESGWSR